MLVLSKSQVESLERATEGMGNDATTEYRLMFIQLTETQARCSELIQEARAAARYISVLEDAMEKEFATTIDSPIMNARKDWKEAVK